jgi:hypothetical protein
MNQGIGRPISQSPKNSPLRCMHSLIALLSYARKKRLIDHSTDSIMVYPLVTAQDKQKSTMQSVKRKSAQNPQDPPPLPRLRQTPD